MSEKKKKKEVEKEVEVIIEPTEIFIPEPVKEVKPESRAMFLAKQELMLAKAVVQSWEAEIRRIEEADAGK